jgi:hypothetical protein
MKTGSILVKLTFPTPWPVLHDLVMMESEERGDRVSVKALSSGVILFVVFDKTVKVVQYTSPQIMISDSGSTTAVIGFVWEENQSTKFYVNGVLVATNPVDLVSLADQGINDQVSITHPDAVTKCEKFVRMRNSAFTTAPSKVNNARRILTIGEQLVQLRQSISALSGLFVEVSNGREHFLGHVATDLRALLYYKENNRNYNPLMLRLAGAYGIELPVYFITSNPIEKFGVVDEATHFIDDPLLSTIRFDKKQELGDLCDCLKQRVIRIRFPGMVSQEPKELSLNEVVLAVATTIGSAHYDAAIPLEVDFIRNLFVGSEGGALIKKIIMDLARVTIECAKYLLERIEQRGSIPSNPQSPLSSHLI